MEHFVKIPVVNYILYICNAVFALFGFLLAIVGIVMINKIAFFAKYTNASDIETLPTLVIIFGTFTVAVALIGCFGVYVENKAFLIIFACATFVLLTLQMALIFWTFVNMREFASEKSDLVLMTWLQNNAFMDKFQIQFNCCGRYSSKDYIFAGYEVPSSCCGDSTVANCPQEIYLSKPGCRTEFYEFWMDNSDKVVVSGIVLIVAHIVALFFTFNFLAALRQTTDPS